MSDRPMKSRTRSVLSVVFSTGTLPFTVVTATSSSCGWSAANMIATASSVPVSTSRITFCGTCPPYRQDASSMWEPKTDLDAAAALGDALRDAGYDTDAIEELLGED